MSNEKRLQQIRDAARYKYPDERIHFIDGAKWADSHPAWVSVEERLPKRMSEKSRFSETVLVYNKEGFNDTAYYDYEEKIWRWLPGVTHWMPLPTPPAKKGGEQ